MYADDIDETRLMLERKVNLWKGTLENNGLKLNVSKTEYMACGSPDSSTILIGPELAVKSEKFRCLGFVMNESGGMAGLALPEPNGGRSLVWLATAEYRPSSRG